MPRVSAPDVERWSPCKPLKILPPPPFLANFWHHPAIFQGETTCFGMSSPPSTRPYPLDGRIIVFEKLITIHTVPSTFFSYELGKFRGVRPSKTSCTLLMLSFDIYIYIDYVLRTFRKHALRDRVVNLNIYRFARRVNWGSKLKTKTTSQIVSTPKT